MGAKKNLSGNLCPDILKRIEQGETLTSIGKSLNVVRSSVTRLLKRNGFSTGFRSNPSWAMEYKLAPDQISVLVGDMFGDGGLCPGGPESAYYQCGHSIEQKEFVDWKYAIYSPLSCRSGINSENAYCMATWSNRDLYTWWKRFYPSGKGNKIICPESVEFLDWRGLAVWFMGDGTRDRNQVHFSVGKEVNLIPVVEVMNQKFGRIFEATFYRREWFLKIRNNEKFFNGISEFLRPYFSYKVPSV